jgi:hypothetical protein
LIPDAIPVASNSSIPDLLKAAGVSARRYEYLHHEYLHPFPISNSGADHVNRPDTAIETTSEVPSA